MISGCMPTNTVSSMGGQSLLYIKEHALVARALVQPVLLGSSLLIRAALLGFTKGQSHYPAFDGAHW